VGIIFPNIYSNGCEYSAANDTLRFLI